MNALRPGAIVDVIRATGREETVKGNKWATACLLHDDETPSAVIYFDTNVYYCSRCTPGHGIGAKKLAELLGVPWMPIVRGMYEPSRYVPPQRTERPKPSFTPEMAQSVWTAASARLRDDDRVSEDGAAYGYLIRRQLIMACEHGVVGLLAPRMELPADIASWPERGYCILAPLYDRAGALVNVQARRIVEGDPRTMFPKDSVATGTLFADERGLSTLRGTTKGTGAIILGEGLTDFLALSIASPVPVLCSPGTSIALSTVNTWARGKHVFIALDNDAAGQNALPSVATALHDFGAASVQRIVWPSGCRDVCDVVASVGTVGLHDFLMRHVAPEFA